MILNPYAIVIDVYATLGGKQPGATSYADHKAYINANGQAAYLTALDGMFATQTNATMSAIILTNLGLASIFTAAQGEAYLAANAGNRVKAALDLASALTNYVSDAKNTNDTAILAAKTTYVATTANAYTYASNSANTSDAATSAAAVSTGQTFTLTTGADLFTGDDSDQTISAMVGKNASTGAITDTLQSVDIIDGAAGNDTLVAQIASAAAAVGPTISNVETISITSFVAQALNMANVSGATKVVNDSSIVASSFTNVGTTVDLGITKVNNNSTSVSYGAAANATLTDAMTLTLNNVSNQAVVTVTGTNAVETLNIKTAGAASKVDIGGTALAGTTAIVVTGDQTLSFDDTDNANAMAAVKSFTSSGSTGKVDADLRSSATDITVVMGATDDSLTLGAVTSKDSVDMGDGADKLTIVVADAETESSSIALAGVETIAFALNSDGDNAAEDSLFNLGGATALTTISVGATTAATKTNEQQISVTQLGSSFKTLDLNGNGAAADTDLNDVVLTYSAAAIVGKADTLSINVTNTDATGNLINSTKGVQLNGAVTANGIESITINSAQLHADTKATVADGGVKLAITT